MLSELSSFTRRLARFITNSGEAARTEPQVAPAETFAVLALDLFRLQYSLNVPYQALCRARGVRPDTIHDWRDIPAASTSAFKEFEFSCLPKDEQTGGFESSGTTRTVRSQTFHSAESLRVYEASLLPWFRRHLLPEIPRNPPAGQPGLAFLSLTPSRADAPRSSLVHMLDVVSRQGWFADALFAGQTDEDRGWILELDRIHAWLHGVIQKRSPVLLAGTAFNFVHLLDALQVRNLKLRLPAGSRIMETGGYKGRSRELTREALHAGLARRLSVPPEYIVTEYGMTELGSQAYDQVAGKSPVDRALRFPPWACALVVSPETGTEVPEGQAGLVRILDLANAFSVLAVETEDLALRREHGLELVGRHLESEPRGCSLMAV